MRKLSTLAVLTVMLSAGPAAMAADATAGQAKAATCAACHGANGHSPLAMWPHLAGQSAPYLVDQLHAFRAGELRNNAQMAPMVTPLSDADIEDLAAYFASLPPATGVARGDIEIGEQLFRGGDLERGVPACMSCHGPAGRGMPAAGYPAVSGQYADYSYSQLLGFKSGERMTGAGLMNGIASKLSEAEMRSVSEYMAGLR